MIAGAITWLLRGWLSRWALTAGGEIKDGWRWLTASPVHALIGLLAVALLVIGLGWHQLDKQSATIIDLTASAKHLREANEAQAGTIRDQQAEIARQNLAVLALGKDGAARIAAGAKADDAALERSVGRTKLSDAITVPAPREAVAGCKTDAAVLAAKGEL